MSGWQGLTPDEVVTQQVRWETERFRGIRIAVAAHVPDTRFSTGAEYLRIMAPTWWVDLSFDRVTRKKRVRFYGDFELAATVLSAWLPEDYWQGMQESVEEERNRFFHNPIPGTKKQAKAKVTPGQLEVGEHTGKPVFGQPLPKKRSKR